MLILLLALGQSRLTQPSEAIQNVQSIPPLITAYSIASLVGVVIIPLFVALYLTLKERNKGYASLGAVLGTVGAVLLTVSFLISSAYIDLAESYAQASAADKGALSAVATGVGGLSFALVRAGLIFLGFGVTAIGGAMRGTATFRGHYGTISVLFGIIITVGSYVGPLPLGSFSLGLFMLGFVATNAWLIIVGFKIYRMSKVP